MSMPSNTPFTGFKYLKPRYTVELTTEGWQVKDNQTGQLGANSYGSKHDAQEMADICNRVATQ